MRPTFYATCGLCGWVHYPISREFAEMSVAQFNAYYDAVGGKCDEMTGPYYFQRSDISQYEHCYKCGAHYSEMKKSKLEDCPTGVPLQPIIWSGL